MKKTYGATDGARHAPAMASQNNGPRAPREPGALRLQTHSGSAPAIRTGRLEGVDLARALAIVGMLMVHVGPSYGDGVSVWLYALPHGRASILFMLVAGVSISLLAAGRSSTPGTLTGRLLWRALLLLPAGLVLQEIDSGRLVILQAYAAMFVLATVLVYLPDRWLLAIAALSAIGGPLGFLYGQMQVGLQFSRAPVSWGQAPGDILHGLVLSGPYPLIVWLAPFALGMWLGRCNLRGVGLRMALVLAGSGAALASAGAASLLQPLFGEPDFGMDWTHLMTMSPHSQMPLWLFGAVGSAIAVLGLALFAADLGGRALWPLVALGQTALTFYVAHLLVLSQWPGAMQSGDPAGALWICLVFTAGAAVLAMAWRSVLPRGPLEMLLQPPWLVVRRWVSARA